MRTTLILAALLALSACALEATEPTDLEVEGTQEELTTTYTFVNSEGGALCQKPNGQQCVCIASAQSEALKRSARNYLMRWFPGVSNKWRLNHLSNNTVSYTTSTQSHWLTVWDCNWGQDQFRWCQYEYSTPTFTHWGYVGIEGTCSRSSHWYSQNGDTSQGAPHVPQLMVY